MTLELKPCPFCGGPARRVYTTAHTYAECTKCFASAAPSLDDDLAAVNWNRRVRSASPPDADGDSADSPRGDGGMRR